MAPVQLLERSVNFCEDGEENLCRACSEVLEMPIDHDHDDLGLGALRVEIRYLREGLHDLRDDIKKAMDTSRLSNAAEWKSLDERTRVLEQAYWKLLGVGAAAGIMGGLLSLVLSKMFHLG